MAITATVYGPARQGLGMGRFDFTTHTFKLLLTTSSYTPNLNLHEYRSDITNEVSGTGYTGGGATVTGIQWTYDSLVATLTADPVVWNSATLTARHAVLYRDTGTAATSPLLSLVDFGANASAAGTPFRVTFANGVLAVTN